MTLTDLPQVQRLSAAEKLQLLGELWDSIAAEPANVPVSAQEKILLEERWQEHLRDPKSALSLEEFKQRLSKYP
jgi:putative addiction module component (TIGR02574 family)